MSSSPYGVFEITDVPKYLDTLVSGKIPTKRDIEELVKWQKRQIKGEAK